MKDPIERQDAIDALEKEKPTPFVNKDGSIDPFGAGRQNQWYRDGIAIMNLPSAQTEDYTEMKQEFLRMASYIDVLLECSDVQKETLMGFISRLAEFMPWTERD